MVKKAEKEAHYRRWLDLPWDPRPEHAPATLEVVPESRPASTEGSSALPPGAPSGGPMTHHISTERAAAGLPRRREIGSVRLTQNRTRAAADPMVRGFCAGHNAQARMNRQGGRKLLLDYHPGPMAPIDEDIGQMAAHEIGAFVRGRVNPKAASFPELETPEMYKVVNGLREHYEWNMHDPGVKRWIWDIACKSYSDFKHDCHKCFLREGVDCLPADFKGREDCWTWLCGHFVSPRFLNYSKANTKNRDKLKRLHHLGARSIAYLVWSIRTGQESGQDINPTFPKISSYCKSWCRDGTEYDQYRPNGDALWAKVTERMNAYRVLHPECSEVEVTEAVQQQEDDIFEEVIVQTKGGANMRFLGRAGKGKRLRSGSASGSSSCTGPSQTISQPPTGPSDAELLAQALEQIKDLQQRMQAMESTKKKKQPVQVEEDEDEDDDDDDDHTGIPGGWSPSVGRTPGSDMVFVRTPRNQQEESSDDDE